MTLAIAMIFTASTAFSFGAVVSTSDSKYTYKDLKADITELTAEYPNILTQSVVGVTADNRNLYCLKLGNPDAPNQIFVTADMHAREYINGQMIMECLEYYCSNYETGSYNNVKYSDLFNNVCIVVMPMVNPDGVAIATGGSSAIRDTALRTALKKMKRYGGYSNWQANANGVDLNRNYKKYGSAKSPQWAYYCGPSVFSEKETQAVLGVLGTCTNVKAFLNIHSMGNVMYWGYYSKTQYKSNCWSLVKLLKSLNGYKTINESGSSNNHGDLEHYIINTYKAPYACVETGTTIPVPHYQLKTIYSKHKKMFAACAYQYNTITPTPTE